MRLISLNSWCGRALHPLMQFFKSHASSTDIFCLQEVLHAAPGVMEERHPDEYVCGQLYGKMVNVLKDFSGVYAVFDDDPNRMSLATFAKHGVPLKTIEDFVIYKPENPIEKGSVIISARKLQYVVVDVGGRDVMIVNYHGLWVNGPKTDTPERIEQSKSIKKFMDRFDGPKILCGDFNLLPETESMLILEEGMRNLIKEFKIKSTRTPLYRHYANPTEPNFADYILVSPEVKVNKFEVLPDLASDHSPLYLEFE
ncbi:MAG: endonuclease/exonuclease/phosphatase family protein [Candidatus Vogelbacteria bacterium]|nr:endonuclease/exonuclease/phosphatase family protein [Candidatus Vogelbacteria bacterium]